MRNQRILVLAIALCPLLVNAQPPRRDSERGRGERIGRVIADCERRTNEFQITLRRSLEHSQLRDTRREDELNLSARRLEQALNRVRASWDRDHDSRRTRRHVDTAIDSAREINRTLTRRRLNPEVQRQWSVVRDELNRMAEVFELPRIGW